MERERKREEGRKKNKNKEGRGGRKKEEKKENTKVVEIEKFTILVCANSKLSRKKVVGGTGTSIA